MCVNSITVSAFLHERTCINMSESVCFKFFNNSIAMRNFTFEKASKKTQIATTYTHAQLYLLFQDFGAGGALQKCCLLQCASQGPFATRSNEHIQKFSQVHVATMTRRFCSPRPLRGSNAISSHSPSL